MTDQQATVILRAEVGRLQEQVRQLRRVALAATMMLDERRRSKGMAMPIASLECAIAALPPGTLLSEVA